MALSSISAVRFERWALLSTAGPTILSPMRERLRRSCSFVGATKRKGLKVLSAITKSNYQIDDRVTAARSPDPSFLVRREKRICRDMFPDS